jgi:hypothetical protein
MEILSNCCGAPPLNDIYDDIAICTDCREWADFEENQE